MRITGPGKPATAATRKTARKTAPSRSSFTDALESGGKVTAGAAPGAAEATSPVAAVDALLALQEAPDAARGRAKGIARAEDMLSLLEDVRRGILLGVIPKTKLQQLARLARQGREGFIDPALDAILDEIELRAEVELAKLERRE